MQDSEVKPKRKRAPLTERGKQNKKAYDKKYMKDRVKQRTIGFNQGDPEDMKMYHWIGSKPNGTQYIKELVREDMKKSGE